MNGSFPDIKENVAVVILNWNGKKMLNDFLPSVIKYSGNAIIYVIDNASTDDSVLFLQKKFPSVQIINNEKNYGFAGGYNAGLKLIKSTYYVLLNSDVEVSENWITPCISLLKSKLNIAACQPKIKNYYIRDEFEYAGAAGGFIDKLGYPFCRGRVFDTVEKDNAQYNDSVEIFWATGACLFIKAKAYHEIGGLDEFYFAHMEEIDMCWRLQNNGYKIMYEPKSTVYHVGGGTLNKINPKKTYLNFRNSLLTLHKNLPKQSRLKVLFIRLFLDGVAGAQFLLKGMPRHTFAIIRAHFAFYGALKQNAAKRTKYQKEKLSGKLNLSVLVSYFLKKEKHFSEII